MAWGRRDEVRCVVSRLTVDGPQTSTWRPTRDIREFHLEGALQALHGLLGLSVKDPQVDAILQSLKGRLGEKPTTSW